MEKVTKQMQKMLMNYRTELVNELSGKYGFVCEEALAYLASKEPMEEEKRGRPAKKVKTLVTKEQEVDAVIMEMLEDSDPLGLATKKSENAASEKSEGTTGEEKEKKKAEKKAKADAKEKKEAEKKEKEPKEKKAEAVVTTITENSPKTVTPEAKTHVGGFPFKNQNQATVTSKDEEDEEADEYEELEFEGKSYFRTTDNVVFDKETERGVGTWNEETKKIDFEEDEEEE